MNIASYLQNGLSTKSQREELIPEEILTKKPENISHLRVFGSVASVEILKKKRHISDI